VDDCKTLAGGHESQSKEGRCRKKFVETSFESAWIQRLKLQHDDPLSNFTSNFSLRHYSKEGGGGRAGARGAARDCLLIVYRCTPLAKDLVFAHGVPMYPLG